MLYNKLITDHSGFILCISDYAKLILSLGNSLYKNENLKVKSSIDSDSSKYINNYRA